MTNKFLIFFAMAYIALFFVSCKSNDGKYNASKKFEKVFNENKTEYIFIKDFMLHNSDSINVIELYQDSLFQVNKTHLKDANNNYISICIDDTLYIKDQNDRASLKKITRFMKSQSIFYIIFIDNKIKIGFQYSSIPCYQLFWEDKITESEEGVVISFKDKNRDFWKYYLDTNWYLKGTPCFN